MQRRWLVLFSVSLMFFFVTGATFNSMGVVLYSMIADLHWSQTSGGTAFSILGVACCLSSPFPNLLMRRIGTRWSLFLGGMLLAAGFLCAYVTVSVWPFYLGTALMGVGFSLAANIPGVYLLASWFPERSARIIGLYLMFGAFGGVVGPSAVNAFVQYSGHWRTHWLLMTVLAALAGTLCLICVRDRDVAPVAPDDVAPGAAAGSATAVPALDRPQSWSFKPALLTPQFFIVAAAMVVTTACVLTMNSAGVLHLTQLGNSATTAAFLLSMQALAATAAKGAAGAISELMSTRLLLAIGLAVECVGMLFLAHADTPLLGYAFALLFGIGWGIAYFGVTVLLINYFGATTGSSLLSTVWLMTIFAAAGPPIAGAVADHLGGYAGVFTVAGLLLLPIAVALLFVRAPQQRHLDGAARVAAPHLPA